jgi:hypothetical protein
MPPCPFRFNPPLTRDEALDLAKVMLARDPAYDDRFVQMDNYTRIYQRTGVCACAKCRARRAGK